MVRDSSYAGQKAYLMAPTENPENLGSWDQNMLFLAEINGDFHCMDGGSVYHLDDTDSGAPGRPDRIQTSGGADHHGDSVVYHRQYHSDPVHPAFYQADF